MPPIVWLLVAFVAGAAGYVVAWPAWQSYRSRETRDLNAERYLAWRGRAVRGQARVREGMTREERRRIVTGAALGVVGALALLAFFFTTG